MLRTFYEVHAMEHLVAPPSTLTYLPDECVVEDAGLAIAVL